MNSRAVWLAVAAMFVLNGALLGIWASRIPTIAEKHDLGTADLGLLLLLLAAGAIVAFPLAGRAADQFGAAPVTRVLGVAYTVSLILIAVSPGYLTLSLTLFIFGAAHGAMDVAMNTWADEVERHLKRRVMSSFHAMFSLGAGLGAGSGFFAASAQLGPATHFVTAGFVVATVTLWVARLDWVSDRHAHVAGGPVFAFPKGPLLAVGVVAFCTSIGEGAMADWSAIFLVQSFSATEATAALGYTVFSIAMVGMRLMGDRIMQVLGPVKSARLAGAVAATGVLCTIAFGTFAMALFGFALMGIGYAVVIPLAFSRAANDPGMSPGAAIASVSTLGYGGLLLGPPLIGFVAELTSLRFAFVILALLAMLVVLLARSVAPVSQ